MRTERSDALGKLSFQDGKRGWPISFSGEKRRRLVGFHFFIRELPNEILETHRLVSCAGVDCCAGLAPRVASFYEGLDFYYRFIQVLTASYPWEQAVGNSGMAVR